MVDSTKLDPLLGLQLDFQWSGALGIQLTLPEQEALCVLPSTYRSHMVHQDSLTDSVQWVVLLWFWFCFPPSQVVWFLSLLPAPPRYGKIPSYHGHLAYVTGSALSLAFWNVVSFPPTQATDLLSPQEVWF